MHINLWNKCPQCQKATLFKGYLDLHENCRYCGLDYDFIDTGDGPAVFVILLAGLLIVAGALYVEVSYQPDYWVHAALWLPLGTAVPLLLLRPLKYWLIMAQYKNKAALGKLDE